MISKCSSLEKMVEADDDSSRSSSPEYWRYLDSMVLRSRQDIKEERKLLNEVCYPAGNYKVIAGLSVARGMLPSVKLVNTLLNLPEQQRSISLADFDWNEFLEIISKLSQGNPDGVTTMQSETENFTVSTVVFFGTRVFKINSNGVTLCFCDSDVKAFLDIKHIVNYRLELIKYLDFRTYYDNFLNYIYAYESAKENIFSCIKDMCFLNMSEHAYYMLELVHFYPNKLLKDFDKLCMYSNK